MNERKENVITYSRFEHDYFNTYKYREPVSGDYRVFVNGEEICVYTCRISKIPFNRAWPGHQREINQSEIASFVNIISDEVIDIKVVVKKEFNKINISPKSKNIEYSIDGNEISFTLENEGQFVLSGDDLHNCLYIFNSKPIACDIDATYYFGPGVHMPGKIQLKDNESIYVDKDALVFGNVYAENAKNIRIFGNGIFDDSNEERFCVHCYENFTNGNVKFYDCENVAVEGVLLRNSAIWCVNIFHCKNVVLDNIKVFGQWRYNTDGIDIVNSRDITVKNSFVHSFDDTVTIKGIDRYIDTNNENILTENCVLWCDWGKTCEIGLETACREYRNIIFRNCDIIRAGNTAIDIQNGDCAEVYDIVFENINVEYNSCDNYPVLQENDESEYTAYGVPFVPNLVSLKNNRFRCEYYCDDIWGVPPEHAPLDLNGIKEACIHDIYIKNINVYYDERIEKVDGKYNVPIEVCSLLDNVEFYNITVENVIVNGTRIDKDNSILTISGVKDFKFE